MMKRLWTKPEIGIVRPMKRSLTSARNVAACYIGAFAEGGSFLLLTPFLVRYLGLGELGLWGLSLALAEWLLLFDLGLREAVLKYVAAHQARDRARDVRRVCDAALLIYLGAALLAVLVGVALIWIVLPLMVEDPEQLDRVRLALTLLVASAAISLPAGLGGTLLEGLSRFDLLNLFRVAHAGLRLVLIVLFLQFGTGLLGVAMAELLARLILHVLRWAAVYRMDPSLIPRPWLHSQVRQEVLHFSSWNALRQVSVVMVGKLYEPILSLLAGMPAVGVFYVGRRLGSLPAEIIGPMTGVILPLSSELEAAGRTRTLQQTLLATTRLALVLALPLGLVLGLGAEPILGNWMGGRTPGAVPVLSVFAFVFMLVAVCLPSEVVLLGLGRSRLLALLGLSQGTLTIVLGPRFPWLCICAASRSSTSGARRSCRHWRPRCRSRWACCCCAPGWPAAVSPPWSPGPAVPRCSTLFSSGGSSWSWRSCGIVIAGTTPWLASTCVQPLPAPANMIFCASICLPRGTSSRWAAVRAATWRSWPHLGGGLSVATCPAWP